MPNGFWVADSFATSLEAGAAARRASATLERQQAFHCGDVVLQRAALAAIEAIDPTHPILNELVQKHLEELGQATFYNAGWSQGCSVQADPYEILSRLQTKHEQDKRMARRQAEAQDVTEKRRGIPLLTRRTVYTWFNQEYPTRTAAEQAKAYRLAMIDGAKLGDL